LKRTYPALLALLFASSSLFAAQQQIDPKRSSLTIHVGKTGLLSAAGHEHTVSAEIAEGSIDDGQPARVNFRVKSARLMVLPEEHQSEVQHSMQERVLESSRFPEISFTSEDIQLAGENSWKVSGRLMLHGQSRLIHVWVRNVDGRYVGNTAIKQTDFGIQPISAAGGTVKAKNELKIDFVISTK
jgi:polyisoprenoid-binding protein YceI